MKEYLDGELAKYEKIKEMPHCLINLLDSEKEQDKSTQLGNLKTKGVGQTTILKFLNGGKDKVNLTGYYFVFVAKSIISHPTVFRDIFYYYFFLLLFFFFIKKLI